MLLLLILIKVIQFLAGAALFSFLMFWFGGCPAKSLFCGEEAIARAVGRFFHRGT